MNAEPLRTKGIRYSLPVERYQTTAGLVSPSRYRTREGATPLSAGERNKDQQSVLDCKAH